MEIEDRSKVDRRLGKTCWENEAFVVRARTERDGTLVVVSHRKLNGREVVPGQYVPGQTVLRMY